VVERYTTRDIVRPLIDSYNNKSTTQEDLNIPRVSYRIRSNRDFPLHRNT